jgi:hypothetical protein
MATHTHTVTPKAGSAGPEDAFLEVVRAYLGAGTSEDAVRMTAPGAMLHVSGASPLAGEYRGREGLLGWRARLICETRGRFGLLRHGPVTRAGDRMVVRLRERVAWGDRDAVVRMTVLARMRGGRLVELSIRPEGDALDRLMRRRPATPSRS